MKSTPKTFLIVIASVLLVAVLCGTVFAYMFKKTQTENNSFAPAKVDCEVSEVFSDNAKSSITVKNTGTVSAYLRVRLVTYWVDGSDSIVGKPSEDISFTPGPGWISGSGNVYYYSSPVEPNGSTENLLQSPITLLEEDGYKQVVEVFAEAIQSQPPEAVQSSWGVTVDSEGKITGEG